jgi:uncharacterized protein with von Willebrand factor type A (vWA) domain
LLERLQGFAALLRQNRVRVSTSELLDAARAAAAVGLEDGATLRAALAATLVKRAGDLRVFDELYALYFLRGAAYARDLAGTPLGRLLHEMGLSAEDIARILEEIGDQAAALSAAGRAGLGVSGLDVPALLQASGVALEGVRLSSPLQVGYYAYRALGEMNVAGAEADLEQLASAVGRALGAEAARALREAIARNLAALKAAVRRFVNDEFERQNVDFMQEFRARTLAERPFALLSEDEIARLRVEVQRLARKLRAQASLRPQHRRRGRLDVRRTLRRSLSTGGIPIQLVRKKKRIDRPRLVVLCDVSDSVKNVSRFMLELVYTLQERFEKVRSYVFVADIGETTDLFRTSAIDEAVRLAYEGAVINVSASSDYGRALELFAERHLDAVTAKTTVIVIGDARNNYNPANAERLAEIRARARRVLWLNPESPAAWGFGDSAMRDYEPHCDKVVVAHNLESLRRVVDDLSV